MGNRDCALLGFRLLGAWLMAQGVIAGAGVPYWFDPQFQQVRWPSIAFSLLPCVVSFIVGVAAWASADPVAARVFPASAAASGDRLRIESVFTLALAIIGVLLLAEAIPILVNGAALLAMSRFGMRSVFGWMAYPQEQQALIWNASTMANIASGLARGLLGVVFLLGPARIVAALAWVRRDFRGYLEEPGASGAEDPPGAAGV